MALLLRRVRESRVAESGRATWDSDELPALRAELSEVRGVPQCPAGVAVSGAPLFSYFLSHRGKSEHGPGTKDQLALPAAGALKRLGVPCFVDRDLDSVRVGRRLGDDLERDLFACAAGVLIVSPDFLVQSPWCKRELVVLALRLLDEADPLSRVFVVLVRGKAGADAARERARLEGLARAEALLRALRAAGAGPCAGRGQRGQRPEL